MKLSIKGLSNLFKRSSTVVKNASNTVGDDLVNNLKSASRKAVSEASKHSDSIDDALKASSSKATSELEKLKNLREQMNVNHNVVTDTGYTPSTQAKRFKRRTVQKDANTFSNKEKEMFSNINMMNEAKEDSLEALNSKYLSKMEKDSYNSSSKGSGSKVVENWQNEAKGVENDFDNFVSSEADKVNRETGNYAKIKDKPKKTRTTQKGENVLSERENQFFSDVNTISNSKEEALETVNNKYLGELQKDSYSSTSKGSSSKVIDDWQNEAKTITKDHDDFINSEMESFNDFKKDYKEDPSKIQARAEREAVKQQEIDRFNERRKNLPTAEEVAGGQSSSSTYKGEHSVERNPHEILIDKSEDYANKRIRDKSNRDVVKNKQNLTSLDEELMDERPSFTNRTDNEDYVSDLIINDKNEQEIADRAKRNQAKAEAREKANPVEEVIETVEAEEVTGSSNGPTQEPKEVTDLVPVENKDMVATGRSTDAPGAEEAKDKKFYEHFFDVTDDEEKFFGKKIKLKKKYIGAGVGAILGTAAITSGTKHKERAKLGDIEAGVSVGTINATFSPTHNKMLNYAQTPEGIKAFDDRVAGKASTSSLAGADAEIVFALHELRNGGM